MWEKEKMYYSSVIDCKIKNEMSCVFLKWSYKIN